MKAIVLCGGLGTRLGNLTHNTPKPLMPVSGRPFLAHVLDQLVTAQIEEIVLAVSFQWQKVEDAIGSRWRDVKVSYSVEAEPLGTGGAIKHAMKQAAISEALVANGDTLLKINADDLVKCADHHRADIVIAIRATEDGSRFGSVQIDSNNRIVGFEEKSLRSSAFINSGMYYLRTSVFSGTASQSFSFEKEILEKQYGKLAIYGFQTSAYFVDIGIPQDLARARQNIAAFCDPADA